MGSLLALLGVGCGEKDKGAPPAGISGLEAIGELPGQIELKWNMPSEGDNIYQIKVTYRDPLLKKDVLRVASAYSEGMLIPDTRQRYGAYAFTVQPFSHTDVAGTAQTASAISGPAPGYYTTGNISDTVELPLTAASLYTNAQQSTEGPIASLLDNDKSTFFHTTWSSGQWTANASLFLGDKHYLQVNLGVELSAGEYFSFYYAPRNNANNKPIDFDLYGSMVGDTASLANNEDWFLIKNFNKEDDGLPDDATTEYRSPLLQVTAPMQYIRLSVNKTNNDGKANNAVFWTMSEFKIFTYKASQVWYNPETDEKD